jgi:hypothetical protein
MTRMFTFPDPQGGEPQRDEPLRDERLGALLRDAVGAPPMGDVDWSALAERVSAAVRSQHAMPWWSYVGRWQRRALPLALAAGLVGALAIWSGAAAVARAEASAYGTGDLVTAVLSGISSDDAASSYAGSVTGSSELVSGVPE